MSGSTAGPAERRTSALAVEHGIAVESTTTPNDPENMSQSPGHANGPDPVEGMITVLRQKGFISGHEATQLYWDYVQEKTP